MDDGCQQDLHLHAGYKIPQGYHVMTPSKSGSSQVRTDIFEEGFGFLAKQ
jgi:hypothetical protein